MVQSGAMTNVAGNAPMLKSDMVFSVPKRTGYRTWRALSFSFTSAGEPDSSTIPTTSTFLCLFLSEGVELWNLVQTWRAPCSDEVHNHDPSFEILRRNGPAGEFGEIVAMLGDDPALATRLGASGRTFVDRTYRWPRIVNAYLDLFAEVRARNRAA